MIIKEGLIGKPCLYPVPVNIPLIGRNGCYGIANMPYDGNKGTDRRFYLPFPCF